MNFSPVIRCMYKRDVKPCFISTINPKVVMEAVNILNHLLAAEPLANLLSQGAQKLIVLVLKTLYEYFVPVLLEGEEPGTNDTFTLSKHVKACSYALSFAWWLRIDIMGRVVPIGTKLVNMVMQSALQSCLPLTCPSVLALLFEELRCLPDISNLEYLETITALYSIYGTEMESKSLFNQKGLKTLIFWWVTGFISKFSTGTLKVVQTFVMCCLTTFTGQPHLYNGPSELKKHHLELIMKHCSDRHGHPQLGAKQSKLVTGYKVQLQAATVGVKLQTAASCCVSCKSTAREYNANQNSLESQRGFPRQLSGLREAPAGDQETGKG
ncbi:hypothetical protein EDC04DRAFT_2607482 [Pisolithus marmoratus]|nr:hypothetical protein EDC04DRAFT_2607482 [Pisolithus marmoratus]